MDKSQENTELTNIAESNAGVINTSIIDLEAVEKDRSRVLADKLSLPLCSLTDAIGYDYHLFYEAGILKLNQQNNNDAGAIWVDFSKGKSAYRQKHHGKGKLPLSRACGIKQGQRPSVIDATAGLGQDAFVLAGLGCKVLCVEQQPVLAELLADGLARASQADPWIAEIVERMQLIQAAAEQALVESKADIIYLDPMYPHHQNRKQAKVKKGMQLFREFPGTSSNEITLLEAAKQAANLRVVVKRPDWASALAEQKPDYTVPAKNHRFDVYQCK